MYGLGQPALPGAPSFELLLHCFLLHLHIFNVCYYVHVRVCACVRVRAHARFSVLCDCPLPFLTFETIGGFLIKLCLSIMTEGSQLVCLLISQLINSAEQYP
jgi:hypothetical protein